jgi:hypothetical protein
MWGSLASELIEMVQHTQEDELGFALQILEILARGAPIYRDFSNYSSWWTRIRVPLDFRFDPEQIPLEIRKRGRISPWRRRALSSASAGVVRTKEYVRAGVGPEWSTE